MHHCQFIWEIFRSDWSATRNLPMMVAKSDALLNIELPKAIWLNKIVLQHSKIQFDQCLLANSRISGIRCFDMFRSVFFFQNVFVFLFIHWIPKVPVRRKESTHFYLNFKFNPWMLNCSDDFHFFLNIRLHSQCSKSMWIKWLNGSN